MPVHLPYITYREAPESIYSDPPSCAGVLIFGTSFDTIND
jgi:hypothetical protein